MLPDNDPYDGLDVPADYKPNCLECPIFVECDIPSKFTRLLYNDLFDKALGQTDDTPFNIEDEVNQWLDKVIKISPPSDKLVNLMRFIAFDAGRRSVNNG